MSKWHPLNLKEYDEPVIAQPVLDQLEIMRSWDDSQVAKAVQAPTWPARVAAKMTLAKRLDYEIQNSGEWKSGPDLPVPPPPAGYHQFRK